MPNQASRKTGTCFHFRHIRNEAEIGLTVLSEKGRLVSLVRYLDQARRGDATRIGSRVPKIYRQKGPFSSPIYIDLSNGVFDRPNSLS